MKSLTVKSYLNVEFIHNNLIRCTLRTSSSGCSALDSRTMLPISTPTTILICSRGIYNVTSVRVQCYVGALARQNTYSTTVQYMMYRRKALEPVPFFGVWTPNSELSYVLNDCGLRLQRSQPFSRSCSAFWERRLTTLILETSASWFITR